MVDRLVGLRHEAVVGRDHQNGNIRDLGAARPHRVERGVTRGIEERDLAALEFDLIGADVLGDSAGFAGGDMCLANRVEQRSLAVIDVARGW